ncbi:CgeB family protein [Persicobacter psychrovividus]|uniref:Spore protein YkvP/CgeB glycosyl transferase-like domain-containing protein n=1 Tax=Persicobacter psychrovividus TaxID=387638 RepID=A0ABM7VCF8_9BACT|nr:hypothetical protein PEPS_08910 [Persicobacter psychrovividus]
MRVLYIGQYDEGTTSKMRADRLKFILKPGEFSVINTNIPFFRPNKVFRSIGFRYKVGPVISAVNEYILSYINGAYDLIWVDKAIYITKKTTKFLKSCTNNLVHFTPDPAFTFHRSKHFNQSGGLYDYLITTKSYELDCYSDFSDSKVLLVTQGFEKGLHKPGVFAQKDVDVVFIGHYEKERSRYISLLLNNGITVALAGIKWETFEAKHKGNSNLIYFGKGVYGTDYVKTLQKAKIAFGSVSKWVPEKHTTRTFEIPACGTALLTEWNEEIASFYEDDEVIYYRSEKEFVEKVKYFLANEEALKAVTKNGHQKVIQGGYDYESIMRKLLGQIFEKAI